MELLSDKHFVVEQHQKVFSDRQRWGMKQQQPSLHIQCIHVCVIFAYLVAAKVSKYSVRTTGCSPNKVAVIFTFKNAINTQLDQFQKSILSIEDNPIKYT